MRLRQQPVRVERPAPPQQTIRSASAALTPSAVQQLQRTVGNRAVGQLLRRTAVGRASSGNAVVQRVGGAKIGFDLPATLDPTIKAGQDLLAAQWRQVRQAEHDLKVTTEKADVEAGAQEMIEIRAREKAREDYMTKHPTANRGDLKAAGLAVIPAVRAPQGFTKYYYGKLTGRQRTDQVNLLKTANEFQGADAKLTIVGDEIKYRPDSAQAWVTIGTLKSGAGAFKVKTAAGHATPHKRDVLEKRGVTTDLSNEAKEYVEDTRGALTRRYAYVEKNYWQMMEFFMINRHEGRFQSFMKAAGEPNPNLFEARQPEVDIVRGAALPESKTQTLTKKQLAVAHQKLGSGPQQRGVSLASTPKVGVTYVNTGENFRTDRGFRLKIDLALIPPRNAGGPLLINHYSHGGVSDKPDKYDTTRKRNELKPSKYPYKESALHARELYLEYLKPEWVVAIESHPVVNAMGTTYDVNTPRGTAPSLFEYAKSRFGGAQFEEGFNEGLRGLWNSLPHNKNHTDGFNHAESFARGWAAGHYQHARIGANDAKAAAAAGITVPQFVYDQSMDVKPPKGEYDIYRLGYLHGRSGAALITAGANLPH